MPITSNEPAAGRSTAWRSASRSIGAQPVAVAGRVLEPLLGRRLSHLLLEPPADRPVVARQELDHLVDHLAVVLLRDVADARRVAALDVEVEARDAAVPAGLRPLARPVAEDAVQDVERLAHLLRVRERAEVPHAAAMALAREHDARVVVLDRDGDVRERLVVAQTDVERRPVALDEVLLEVQRLDLAAGDDRLDRHGPVRHRANALARVARARLEVLAGRADAASSPCRRTGPRPPHRGRGRPRKLAGIRFSCASICSDAIGS